MKTFHCVTTLASLVLLTAAAPAAVSAGFISLPIDSTGHRRQLQSYSACGAGEVFTMVDCSTPPDYPDLRNASVDHSSGTCANYIQCGGGGGELYTVNVETWAGTDKDTRQPKYYAIGSAVNKGDASDVLKYCWKRLGSKGDGCACLCYVVLKGSILGSGPECKCMF